MSKDIIKHIKPWPVIVGMVLPIALNIFGDIRALSFFGSYYGIPKLLVEKPLEFILYLANWPSILFKIYPFEISQQGEIVYDMFAWVNLKILTINVLSWGLIGIFCNFLIQKYKRPVSKSDDRT